MRALLSVSDKTGLVDFGKGLVDLGWDLVGTTSTKRALDGGGVACRTVEDITSFPEIMDGRVKTLHPLIYGGILGRRDSRKHMNEALRHGIFLIDLVAVNLYPFVQTVSKADATLEETIENIDIGGPSLIRAAAKNFTHVLVLVDPADYPMILEKLQREGWVDLDTRKKLAQKAFQHVAAYDTAIASYLRADEPGFPSLMTLAMKKVQDLRYGENPHQKAAYYAAETWHGKQDRGLARGQLLAGAELSFNNILDLDSAWIVATDFEQPTVAIIKHTNACGLATHPDLTEAYRRAYEGDTVSAYGGIVALNRPVDAPTARAIRPHHYDAIIAPAYYEGALDILKRKRGLRIVAMGWPLPPYDPTLTREVRTVRGGFLVQTTDFVAEDASSLKVVTQRAPTAEETKDLLFAWRAVKHLKSNGILLVKDATLLGMGTGQPNRMVSVKLALEKAGQRSRGSVLASDAYFPFTDGIELAASGGVTAIIQPGGSIRDEEVIQAADAHNMAMIFTGVRHFKH